MGFFLRLVTGDDRFEQLKAYCLKFGTEHNGMYTLGIGLELTYNTNNDSLFVVMPNPIGEWVIKGAREGFDPFTPDPEAERRLYEGMIGSGNGPQETIVIFKDSQGYSISKFRGGEFPEELLEARRLSREEYNMLTKPIVRQLERHYG